MASTRSTNTVAAHSTRVWIAITFVASVAVLGLTVLLGRPKEVTLSASWAQRFASLDSLRGAAALVVVGQVEGIVYEGDDAQSPGVATTRFSFAVERTIKGRASATIVVKQTGGRLGNTVQRVADDPPMAVNDRYLLYLTRVTGGPYDGDYVVLGGPDGRFAVAVDGTLRSLGSVALQAGTSVTVIR